MKTGRRFFITRLAGSSLLALLAACASNRTAVRSGAMPTAVRTFGNEPSALLASEVVVFSLGLLETGYRFGGKNPASGLDCSGMVSYVYGQAAGYNIKGSAADLAKKGWVVAPEKAAPGDLVFFNTRGFPYSHVGIYLGGQRFIHAPNSNGKVRTESLTSGWFAERVHEVRRYLT